MKPPRALRPSLAMPRTRSSTRLSSTFAVSSVRTPEAVSSWRNDPVVSALMVTLASAVPPAGTVSSAGSTLNAAPLDSFSAAGAWPRLW